MELKETLEKLIRGENLTADEMTMTMDSIMDGECTPAQIGAVLTALRMKGESITEIAAAAKSMRDHATNIDAGAAPIVDIVGTGGDGSHSFNVSTVAMFIAAGAGVKLAKHGNRSVSSKCGSADVLKELGVNLEIGPEKLGDCIRTTGLGFLFAPKLHGAMKYAIGPRRELGVRTIFNMLGPLTNPAGATALVLGVFDKRLTRIHAAVLKELGVDCAMVVHGKDGLDEITGTTTTFVTELRHNKLEDYELDPRPYIGEYCSADDLRGGEPAENARIAKSILAGEETGPKSCVAMLNAAAAIYIEGIAENLEQAYELANGAIEDGKALKKLHDLVQFTNA